MLYNKIDLQKLYEQDSSGGDQDENAFSGGEINAHGVPVPDDAKGKTDASSVKGTSSTESSEITPNSKKDKKINSRLIAWPASLDEKNDKGETLRDFIDGDIKQWVGPTALNIIGKDGTLGGPGLLVDGEQEKGIYVIVRMANDKSQTKLELDDRIYFIVPTKPSELKALIENNVGIDNRAHVEARSNDGIKISLRVWKEEEEEAQTSKVEVGDDDVEQTIEPTMMASTDASAAMKHQESLLGTTSESKKTINSRMKKYVRRINEQALKSTYSEADAIAKHGSTTYTLNNGAIWRGEIAEGIPSGPNPQGSKFRPDGAGELKYLDGKHVNTVFNWISTGVEFYLKPGEETKNPKKHSDLSAVKGAEEHILNNGTTWEGKVKDSKPDGPGVIVWHDGKRDYKGDAATWFKSKGKSFWVKSTAVEKHILNNGTTWEGAITSDGVPTGKGTHVWNDGKRQIKDDGLHSSRKTDKQFWAKDKGSSTRSKSTKSSSPFKNKEEGDAFRTWANSTPELVAKYGPGTTFDLDPPSSKSKYNNSFIKKAYADAKDKYESHLAAVKNGKSEDDTDSKYKAGDIVYYKSAEAKEAEAKEAEGNPGEEEEEETNDGINTDKMAQRLASGKSSRQENVYAKSTGANPRAFESIATTFDMFNSITEEDADSEDEHSILLKATIDGNIKKGKVVAEVDDDKVKITDLDGKNEKIILASDIVDGKKAELAAKQATTKSVEVDADEDEPIDKVEVAQDNLDSERDETKSKKKELKDVKKVIRKNKKSSRHDRKQAKIDDKIADKKRKAKQKEEKANQKAKKKKNKKNKLKESVVLDFDSYMKSVNS